MSQFSQEHSHGPVSEGKAGEGWTEVFADCHSFYGGQELEDWPDLGATMCSSPAISPLPDAGSDVLHELIFSETGDCKGKECVGGWPKREEKEIINHSLMASATTELSPNEVFVFNIKYSTTKAQLEAVFSRCGAVANATLPFDETANRIKGYAFVAFERDESVKRAIVQLNGFYLNARPLSVRRKTESKWPSARTLQSAHTHSATVFPSAVQWSAGGRKAAVGVTETVFVGNIPFEVKRPQIWSLFAATSGAPLKSVRLVTTELGLPRGFGYVDFYSEAAATRALALNGHVLCGRVLRVNYAEGYQPDYCKKRARAFATDAQRVGYFPFVQVPRGYALVPMQAIGALAMRPSPQRYMFPPPAAAWTPPVADMLPSADGVQYYANHQYPGGRRAEASVPHTMGRFDCSRI